MSNFSKKKQVCEFIYLMIFKWSRVSFKNRSFQWKKDLHFFTLVWKIVKISYFWISRLDRPHPLKLQFSEQKAQIELEKRSPCARKITTNCLENTNLSKNRFFGKTNSNLTKLFQKSVNCVHCRFKTFPTVVQSMNIQVK